MEAGLRVTFSLSGIFQVTLEVEQFPEALDPKHDDRAGRARLEADAPGAALPDAHGSSEHGLGGDLAPPRLLRHEEKLDGRKAPISFRIVALVLQKAPGLDADLVEFGLLSNVLRGDGSDESRRWRKGCTGLYGASRRRCALADGVRPAKIHDAARGRAVSRRGRTPCTARARARLRPRSGSGARATARRRRTTRRAAV